MGQALGGIFPLPEEFDITEWAEEKIQVVADEAVKMAWTVYNQKEQELGEENLRDAERQIMLWAVDNRWVRHLTDLDHLREGIGLRAFAQVDPLVAYKQESFRMYQELMGDIRGDIVKAVFSLQKRIEPQVTTAIARNIRTNRSGDGGNGGGRPSPARKSAIEVGRNDPCWCGSGKKYKHCHAKSDAKSGVPAAKSSPTGRT